MSTSTEKPVQKAVAYVVYDLILITLACISPDLWMRLLCIFLFAIATIRALSILTEAIFCSELIEEEFGLRLDESQD